METSFQWLHILHIVRMRTNQRLKSKTKTVCTSIQRNCVKNRLLKVGVKKWPYVSELIYRFSMNSSGLLARSSVDLVCGWARVWVWLAFKMQVFYKQDQLTILIIDRNCSLRIWKWAHWTEWWRYRAFLNKIILRMELMNKNGRFT